MTTRFIQRSGTAAEWAAANPILAEGELGYDTTNDILKAGDGITPWNLLRQTWLSESGGTMHGPLHVPAPTLNDHAANKAYLDAVDADVTDLRYNLTAYTAATKMKAYVLDGTTWSIGTGTDIEMDFFEYESGGWTLDANGKVVCPKSGIFIGRVVVHFDAMNVTTFGTVRRIIWVKRGTGGSDIDTARWEWGTNKDDQVMTLPVFTPVSVNDTFHIRGYSGGSGAGNYQIKGNTTHAATGVTGLGTYIEGVIL